MLSSNCFSFHSEVGSKIIIKSEDGASLVAQWLRICLLMQGTRVRALVRELDPTCMPQLRVRMLQLRPNAAKIKLNK